MGRRKGSLNKSTLEHGTRTRAAVKAGLFPTGQPGRPRGSKNKRVGSDRDRAEILALLFIEAGANPNAAARAALTEIKHGYDSIAAAEQAQALEEWDAAITIDAQPSIASKQVRVQIRPGSDDRDEGFPTRWIGPAFAAQAGRRKPAGRVVLEASGVEAEPHKGATNDADTLAKRLRPIVKDKAAAADRAAKAYCDAVLAYEADHGLIRVSDDGDWARRYANITPEQQQDMLALARAAAERAAGEPLQD